MILQPLTKNFNPTFPILSDNDDSILIMPKVVAGHHFEDVELSPRDDPNPSQLINKSIKSSTLEESSHGDRTRVNVISKYQSV